MTLTGAAVVLLIVLLLIIRKVMKKRKAKIAATAEIESGENGDAKEDLQK